VTATLDLKKLCARGLIDPSWAMALAPVQSQLTALAAFLEQEAVAGFTVLPEPQNIMRVFKMPVDAVRVLIVGQDPYPTPGHAIGLSFAVAENVRPLPRSLNNIFAELETDMGTPRPVSGDLTGWSHQGVMLLNRVLTVGAGEAGSHRDRGWEAVTDLAIHILAMRHQPLVAILWGKQAASLRSLLGNMPIIESAHPSPLSARRGFFGSQPFTRANELLTAQGAAAIDWSVTSSGSASLG